MDIKRLPQNHGLMHERTRLLIEQLRDLDYGIFLSYTDLNSATSLALPHIREHMASLRTARRYLQKVRGMTIICLPGQGVVRLREHEKAGHMVQQIGYIHRKARRQIVVGQSVDIAQLTQTQQMQHLGALSAAGMVAYLTHEKTLHAIEAAHTPQVYQLEPKDYLGLFQGL